MGSTLDYGSFTSGELADLNALIAAKQRVFPVNSTLSVGGVQYSVTTPGGQFVSGAPVLPAGRGYVSPSDTAVDEFLSPVSGEGGGGATTNAQIASWAGNLDALITGAITRDANGAATSAAVAWPDGATGAYAATTVSSAFPGAVDAYTVTHILSGATKTATQAAVTRDGDGAVVTRPAIAVA